MESNNLEINLLLIPNALHVLILISEIQRLETSFQFVFADQTDGHRHRQHSLRTNDDANVAEIERKYQRSSANGQR